MNPKRTPMLVAATAALSLLAACDRDPTRDAAETAPASPPATTAPASPPTTTMSPAPTPLPGERVGEDTVGDRLDRAGDAMEAQGEKVGAAIDDATLTARVKAAFVADPTVSALDIDVDSNAGVVTLRGNVETAAAVDRALTIARDTEGVVSVDNQLVVSSG